LGDESIIDLSASALGEKIRIRDLSPVEVTRAHLDQIKRHNDTYAAFITIAEERALTAAKKAEAEIISGRYRGPLHGVPYGAKDIFDTAEIRTTNGASFYRDNVPARNAECVNRLEAAGAILIGKCNTHEFAAGSTTINQNYGTARNPWDVDRIVGGSSGGSACALAARMIPIALGSDTGGSIRTPAALCGVVGLKPTMGRISLRGIYPNVPTIDHPGPMARTVTDAALALQAIAGYDPQDPKSVDRSVPDFMAGIETGIKGAKIAVSPDFTQNSEVDGDIAKAFEQALDVLRGLGASVETVPFEGAERFPDLFRRIAGPEFSEVHRKHFGEDPDAYDREVRERVEWSVKVPLDDYVRALRERELVIREVDALMSGFDAMVSPAVPVAAPLIETRTTELNGREVDYKNLHRPFLSPHNLTGCPAIVMPMGFNRQGLPIAIQIASGRWREADMLRVARAYEVATPELRNKRPPMTKCQAP
jgi:aspartyl-tRNA(Asn)/glutamyl-tRNA(Gln) amidotransferase subunit A